MRTIAGPHHAAPNLPVRLDLLAITVNRHAKAHDGHTSPIVGCYLCLHQGPRRLEARRIAA